MYGKKNSFLRLSPDLFHLQQEKLKKSQAFFKQLVHLKCYEGFFAEKNVQQGVGRVSRVRLLNIILTRRTRLLELKKLVRPKIEMCPP